MRNESTRFEFSSDGLRLRAAFIPWDIEVFGFPVVQIQELSISDWPSAAREYHDFRQWLDRNQVNIVSCRMPHDRLRETMFLESKDFRFIEMVLHPKLSDIQSLHFEKDCLTVSPAMKSDLPVMKNIAEHAFGHERYHIDPRLDRHLADLRYGRWVENSFDHPSQRLLKVMDRENIIGLFIVEPRDNELIYWHLTAIDPQWQGKGYGQRVWRSMLRHHQKEGHDAVMTTISARNIAVLNLHAKLGFRFLPPEMTFHWVREDE